uniref:NADH-ubiquinone oxidoreductase chain 5 n=1 Tax=Nuttallochiton mirandus TaxID=256062 RepID=A0A6H1PFZ8_NULMI|nr:NADH dehydrogenase subunit 5 [Nuttallochiton mirandus]
MKWYKNSASLAAMTLMTLSVSMLILTITLLLSKMNLMLEISLFELNSSFISLPVIMDWMSSTFSTLVCFISSCVMIFSKSYMSQDKYISRFIWIVMLFVLSMNFLIFIPSMVSLLLGWDGLGLVSFILVIYYQNQKSLGAGLMTAFMNRIGDVAILLAIGWSISQGHWNIMFMWEFYFYKMVIFMILLAGMTKSAQIPFCSWLPAAMAAPTPVSALVHSSTLVTAGVYLLIRFYPFLSKIYMFNITLGVISAMTMVMAGIAANFEMDLKKIIALSTLSQLGVMMFSISIGLPSLALFHLFVHALFKALLFLCAGSIIHAHSNNQDIRKMSHLWSHLPISSTCLNVANLALCGFPFMAGFYSKDLIIEMMLFNQTNMFLILMMTAATILTASYSTRLSIMIMWSEMKQTVSINASDEDPFITIPIIMLTMGAVMSGSALSWLLMAPMDSPLVPADTKMLPLMMVMFGAIAMYQKSKMNLKKNINMPTLLSVNMWFMSSLSNNLISEPPMSVSTKLFKMLDLGWMESLQGEGVFISLYNTTIKNQQIQNNLFNLLVSLSLASIIFSMAISTNL